MIDYHIKHHPGWQKQLQVERDIVSRYEAMRARDPSLPQLEDAVRDAADYLGYEIDALTDEMNKNIGESRGLDRLVSDIQANKALMDHLKGAGDVNKMDRAQREQFLSMMYQSAITVSQVFLSALSRELEFRSKVVDRVLEKLPFDETFRTQTHGALQSVRDLKDYHVVTGNRVWNKASDEVEEKKGKITDLAEKIGVFRGEKPTTDLVVNGATGKVIVHLDGSITISGVDPDDPGGDARTTVTNFIIRTGRVDPTYLERFIRANFYKEEAELALLAIKLERERQQRAKGGPQANTRAVDAILAEMQALMSTPGFSFDDPRWKFLQDLLAKSGLPELQFPPDIFAEFLNGTRTLTVAVLEPIYADADMTRGERIERMTENLWAAAQSTVIHTPDVWAAGPSKVTTTPNVWSEGPSNVATTPKVWSEGQSNVASTPKVWSEGQSNVATTPDMWAPTPDYWGDGRDLAIRAADRLKSNTSAIGSASARRMRRPQGGEGIDYPYNERPIGLFLVNAQNIQETAWAVIQGDQVHYFEGATFGPIAPPAGASGPISALNNSGGVQTTMVKEWKLGANQRIFTLDGFAKFVTTEYPRFIGSQFNDTSTITLTTPGGQSITVSGAQLFGASVNATNFAPVANLPAPLSGWNSGGAVNNGGGEAAWQRINRALRVAPGGRVRITVTVQNVGDTAYPSATLLTKLRGSGSQ